MSDYRCQQCGEVVREWAAWLEHGCPGKARRYTGPMVVGDEIAPLKHKGKTYTSRAKRNEMMRREGLTHASDFPQETLDRNRRKHLDFQVTDKDMTDGLARHEAETGQRMFS